MPTENNICSIWKRPTKQYELYQYYIKISVKEGGWTTKVIASNAYNALKTTIDKCREKDIEILGVTIKKSPTPVNRTNREKEIRLKYFANYQILDEDF